MEEIITQLKRTSKKDFFENPRRENLFSLAEGDVLTGEIHSEDTDEDSILISDDIGVLEFGEITGNAAYKIITEIENGNYPIYSVHQIKVSDSGKVSVDVKVNIMTKFEARARGLLTYEFHTKLAGVTQPNADGRSRQDIIANELQEDQELFLAREPENKYDPNAIAVITGTYSETVGYLSKNVAGEIAPQIDQHQLVTCQIKNITGLADGDKSLGVNLLLKVYSLADTENIARNTAAKYQKEAQSEPVEVLPIVSQPAKISQKEAQSDPTTSRFVKVNDPAEFITSPQTTAEAHQTTTPKVKKKNSFFTKIADWWRSRSKKTRIWIIVFVIVLLIGICGNMK